MAAEQAKEGGEVVQGLEPVDVGWQHQVVKGGSHAQEDGRHLHTCTMVTNGIAAAAAHGPAEQMRTLARSICCILSKRMSSGR